MIRKIIGLFSLGWFSNRASCISQNSPTRWRIQRFRRYLGTRVNSNQGKMTEREVQLQLIDDGVCGRS